VLLLVVLLLMVVAVPLMLAKPLWGRSDTCGPRRGGPRQELAGSSRYRPGCHLQNLRPLPLLLLFRQ
jgi:hypothetical protein